MFDFENKPIQDWTLAEAKEYCKNKYVQAPYSQNCRNSCILSNCKLCSFLPKEMNFNTAIKFTSDEIAFCRLIKKTYPCGEYIARGKSGGLRIFEKNPTVNEVFCEKPNTKSVILNDSFFPQIKPLTCYSIDDIIKQGENSNA